jgi:hypothetical protein
MKASNEEAGIKDIEQGLGILDSDIHNYNASGET